MNASLALLDKALVVAQDELVSLQDGDVDAAQVHASERFALTEEAWSLRGEDPGRLSQLQDKLQQLQSMQGRLTMEARRLHASIKEELIRSRKEGARHSAYGKALRPQQGFGSPTSRFMSKRG